MSGRGFKDRFHCTAFRDRVYSRQNIQGSLERRSQRTMAVQTNIKEVTKSRLKKPSLYHVIMHNDDFTTMEFVVEILMTIFNKEEQEAVTLMLSVHNSQGAVVGTYSYDIARTKAEEAERRAREEGFPFRLTVEKA